MNNLKKQKERLELVNFEAASINEMLVTRGGQSVFSLANQRTTAQVDGIGGTGGGGNSFFGSGDLPKAGDPNGFGGTFDQDAVGVNRQSDANCPTCNHLNYYQIASPRSTYAPLGALFVFKVGSHTSGCDGDYSNNNYNR